MHKYGNNDAMASATHLVAAGVLFKRQESDTGLQQLSDGFNSMSKLGFNSAKAKATFTRFKTKFVLITSCLFESTTYHLLTH